MSGQISSPRDSADAEAVDRAALQTFGLALNETLITMTKGAHRQQVAVIGLAALIAALQETVDIDPKRVGAAISAVLRGRSDAAQLTREAAEFAATILAAAREARASMAAGKSNGAEATGPTSA